MKKTFKEFLAPPGYSEGPMSLVTHMGILYKLDRIFELSKDLPVTNIATSELKWQVENQIVPSVGQTAAKPKRKLDMKVPIIVLPVNGKYVIIDGFHRAQKALKDKLDHLPARVIFADIMAMSRFGSGPDVAFASNVDDINAYLGEDKKFKVPYMLRGGKGGKKEGTKTVTAKDQEDAVKAVKKILRNDNPGASIAIMEPKLVSEEEKPKKVEVKRDPGKFVSNPKRWAIFVDDKVVEGGFHDRGAAVEQAAKDYGYKDPVPGTVNRMIKDLGPIKYKK